jgi:hypothetical protein
MTWSLVIAFIFYALGFLLGASFSSIPVERDCDGCLFNRVEPPYRRVLHMAYRQRNN